MPERKTSPSSWETSEMEDRVCGKPFFFVYFTEYKCLHLDCLIKGKQNF